MPSSASPERPRIRSPRALTAFVVAGWAAIYAWRSLAAFYSLNTSAFDLSVFDYALASLARGGAGDVPFIGHSIFSHHFMPILALLAPARAIVPSPAALLIVQIAAIAAAAWLFGRFAARTGVPPIAAAALVFVFLFARRMHAAMSSMFYPECLQAPLIFALVLAWTAPARRWYWAALVLLLMTKEDAGIYAAAFGALQAVISPTRRRDALATAAIAAVWTMAALFIAIPAARVADGLPAANPLLEARFGVPGSGAGATLLIGRLLSVATLERIGALLATSGFLALWSPRWLLPALPGVLVNLGADPATLQADLMNHYAWPVLPWIALAGVAGWLRVRARWPRIAAAWLALLVVVTAADSPALQRLHRTRVDPAATRAIAQARQIPLEGVVLAQPNLIPHLPHHASMFAAGGDLQPSVAPDVVLLTEVGNLWPLSLEQTREIIARHGADPRYERLSDGPLHAFRLR
jgi:uncharacterized membrane protein